MFQVGAKDFSVIRSNQTGFLALAAAHSVVLKHV